VSIEAASWTALGTNVELLVTGGPVEPARLALAALLEQVDATYSRFRDDSELSRLQARGAGTVSPLLGRAVEVALAAAAATDGLVDPTVGRALRLAGYDRDFSLLSKAGPLNLAVGPLNLAVEQVPGWRALDWQPGQRRLRLPPGVELDLGATGKALAVDLGAAAALAALPPAAGVLVGVGGDVRAVGRAPVAGWRVRLAEDSSASPDQPGELAVIEGGGLATSSTTVRRWRAGSTIVHHLIDPRTGRPAESPWRTVSVYAPTCVEANTAASAAVILGRGAIDWLTCAGVAARLVGADGAVAWAGPWQADEAAPPAWVASA
jgi:thiamine biosynthesis lipoprotein